MTKDRVGVHVEGLALNIGWRDRRLSLAELIFETVYEAVGDAGRGLDGIDAVILAAHDLVDGRSLSSMVTAPAAGAYLRDEIRFSDDGAAAFAAAVARIEAGESERVIVAAWGRASEHDPLAVSRILFDPAFGRPLGLEEVHVSAMRAQAWRRRHGDADASAAVAARRAAAATNPRSLREGGKSLVPAYPLTEDTMPVFGDIVAAMILSTTPAGVRVAGIGEGSEPYFIGDRDLNGIPSLQLAVRRAYDDAGCEPGSIDIAEIDGLTLYDEAMGCEASGLAEPGRGLAAIASGQRINRSGGGAAGYCAPAMGLVRIVEACFQLQGRAGAIQAPKPRRALATGSSVVAGQTQTAVILEAA